MNKLSTCAKLYCIRVFVRTNQFPEINGNWLDQMNIDKGRKKKMLSQEMHEKLMGEIGRSDKFIELMGIKIVAADEGYCKGELEVTEQHLNPLGTVHGGCLYTLADTVAGFAAASCGFEGPTLSGNMYFLRPTMGVKKLTCESRVVKNGKRIRVVEATIYGDNGQEISRSLLEYMDMQREMVVKQ